MRCRIVDVRDGASQTLFIGEKAGSRLTYRGPSGQTPDLPVEFPWAMAAVSYFAPTGGVGVPNSYWVAGPYAVTADVRLPACPDDAGDIGTPFPMNPLPKRLGTATDDALRKVAGLFALFRWLRPTGWSPIITEATA